MRCRTGLTASGKEQAGQADCIRERVDRLREEGFTDKEKYGIGDTKE